MARPVPDTHARPRWPRIYYGIGGLLALLAALLGIFGAAQAALRGCRVVFSQSDFDPSDPNAIPPEGSCTQFVDVLGIALPLVLGLILVAAAWRYGAADRSSRMVLAFAIPAGVLVGVVPLIGYWQLHSFYRMAYGPAELLFFALGLAILLLALLAGWRTAALLRPGGRWATGPPPDLSRPDGR